MPSDAVQCKPLEVVVSDRGIERAIKMLKRKLASEGVLRELKMRRHYMKPSVKRRKKQAEAARRRRKCVPMKRAGSAFLRDYTFESAKKGTPWKWRAKRFYFDVN